MTDILSLVSKNTRTEFLDRVSLILGRDGFHRINSNMTIATYCSAINGHLYDCRAAFCNSLERNAKKTSTAKTIKSIPAIICPG
jgi:hypothetical protein